MKKSNQCQRSSKILNCILFSICFIGLNSTNVLAQDEMKFHNRYENYVNELKRFPCKDVIMFSGQNGLKPYSLFIHSAKISSLLKNTYETASLNKLIQSTLETRKISVVHRSWGTFVQAANFVSPDIASQTNYDAIWLRDSVWAYLALDSQHQETSQQDAHQVLLTLWDYLSTPEQLKRMKAVIANPSLLTGAEGQMMAPHIRFDSKSSHFADIMVDGKPQSWTHKQNDALGLLIDTVLQNIEIGKINTQEWNQDNRLKALIYLVGYFDKAQFYQMEDSGAWEEALRLNTSSIALVTSALENMLKLVQHPNEKEEGFVRALQKKAQALSMSQVISQENLLRLVDLGYKRIDKQLSLGGESPDYKNVDSRYRKADAALLNLIYPAQLKRLTIKQKEQVLNIVAPLMGDIGIRRYFNDNYQSANFWFHNIKTDTDSKSYEERLKQFVPGSEAQWFFDSWYAKSALIVYKENRNPYYWALAVRSMNRALSQITGEYMKGADGQPVQGNSLPESYNFIAHKGQLWESPSPITPLNWSKASMTLMFHEFSKILISK
ncbi:hypothetical protein COMNV_00370 [Commensalibacter sp. Nvir]|nr:hypothetical protein COMNV_00370 [Commensalibacter sp. Nvir]